MPSADRLRMLRHKCRTVAGLTGVFPIIGKAHPPSLRSDVLFFTVIMVKKPTFVQVTNLPPVFPLKSPLQLVAQPLRHGKTPSSPD
jgi:hypothetical protein